MTIKTVPALIPKREGDEIVYYQFELLHFIPWYRKVSWLKRWYVSPVLFIEDHRIPYEGSFMQELDEVLKIIGYPVE